MSPPQDRTLLARRLISGIFFDVDVKIITKNYPQENRLRRSPHP